MSACEGDSPFSGDVVSDRLSIPRIQAHMDISIPLIDWILGLQINNNNNKKPIWWRGRYIGGKPPGKLQHWSEIEYDQDTLHILMKFSKKKIKTCIKIN